MSDWDDLEDVTPRISSEDAERLLSGTAGIDGIHDLSDLSTVLDALREPADATELSGLPAVLVAFGAADVTAHSDPSTPRTLPMKKRLTRKSLAAIGVITLVSAGAAAAAGVVPTPFSASRPSVATSTHGDTDDSTDETIAEDTAVDTTPTTDEVEADETTEVAQVDADNAGKVAEPADATVSTDGQGPDVNGPAKFGLCTAYAARTKHDVTTTTLAGATATAEPLPVPFQSLSDAADAAGQTVAEFCADAVPGGSADAPGQSGDNPSATAPGHSGDNPSATAPGHSGDNPSATAPGHSGDNPSATAPGHSGDNPGAAHGPATTHP